MNLKSPGLWIGLISLGGVLYLVLGDVKRNSPGPLASVHAVALNGSCKACHGGWFQSMTDACLECHDPIANQLSESVGLHGTYGLDLARACTSCHSDHHGAGFAMVNDHTFMMAGVPDRTKFDHTRIGFVMKERHLEAECAVCHVNADTLALAEGQSRYLGLDQNCATCHEDPHGGRYVLDCADCHGQKDFKILDSPRHAEVLPLIGGHADVTCAQCHDRDALHSLDSLGKGRKPQPRQCIACHDSPHRPEFLEQLARTEGVTVSGSCSACHESGHLNFREPNLTIAQHALTGFRLDLPHDEAECSDCHAVNQRNFRARYPGRGKDECVACHEDPHNGQFAVGRFAEAGCVGCHDRHQFEPHTFSIEQHSGGALPLEGSHAEQACHACHRDPVEGSPRLFHGMDPSCESCHDDAHQNYFGARVVVPGGCERCHDASSFSDVPNARFDHTAWTGFTVTGAHAQQACEICHKRSAKADAAGRTFGRISEHFGSFTGCATCHKDPHLGEFDGVKQLSSVEGREGCERCHVQASFRVLPFGFDHKQWTGAPLEGAHEAAGCSACHKPLRRSDKDGRTWQRARGTNCADCHDDPHLGQFERMGRTDCTRCHRSQVKFSAVTFRHNLDSRFELGEAHKRVACDKCHKPVKRDNGVAVQYRGLGHDCVDCHGQQNQILRGRRRRR